MTEKVVTVLPKDYAAIAGQCACTNFRRASRAVTQHFDEAFAPIGLRSTQVCILVAIGADEPASIAGLSRELVMDTSTVTRNLKPLQKLGLIEKTTAGVGRRLALTLTDKGRAALLDALPLWEHAQHRVVSYLGDARWNDLRDSLSDAVDATQNRTPAVAA